MCLVDCAALHQCCEDHGWRHYLGQLLSGPLPKHQQGSEEVDLVEGEAAACLQEVLCCPVLAAGLAGCFSRSPAAGAWGPAAAAAPPMCAA
jgi:hypothetical protein